MQRDTLFQRRRSTGLLCLTALLLFSLALTACGGPDQQQKGPKSTVLTLDGSEQGDLTKNFNPFNSSTAGVQGLLYEPLMYFNQFDGTSKPMLASSYVYSNDAKTITFTLRSDVKWSDGQPLTSDDVAFTFNLMKKYPDLDTSALWKTLKSVENPDVTTVVVTLQKAYSPLLWYLAGQTWIVPRHTFAQVSNPTKFTNDNPVSSGPFTVKSFTPQLLVYAKNPNFRDASKLQISEVRAIAFKSNTSAELALDQGELDWGGLYTPNINQTFVARNPQTNHYWFPVLNNTVLFLNLTKFPFNQLAVRQAISLVLDRDQIAKVGESGYVPVSHPTGLVLPPHKSFLTPEYANASFSIDVARARQLLEAAGFIRGSDGIYADKTGRKIEFKISVVTGWTNWITDTQIMAQNLNDLGMKASVNVTSQTSWGDSQSNGSFDAAINGTNGGPTPFYQYNGLLNSNNTAPVGQPAPSNVERWNDLATDKLLDQYASTTDPVVQQQALNGLEKIMVEQLPVIQLVGNETLAEFSTAHFTGWPDAQHPYAVPAWYNAPDNEIILLNLKPV